MKTKKYIQIAIIGFVTITGLTFNSCKKDKDPAPAPPVANGTLFFHIHTNVDTAEVENYDSLNITSIGRKITVHKAQLYISGIQLIKLDGSTYDVPGAIALIKQGTEVYMVGNVPSGNYRSVKFNVGLSAATNASTPAAADSTLNQPAMWFGATAQPSGFVFLNFQGTIDTTTAANGSIAQMQPFSYKIGTNTNLKSVTMPDKNYTVSPNQAQYIHMVIDYNMLLMGIPLNVNPNLNMSTTAANATALGTQLTNNIPMMFMYEM
jgi:hypothetical protein